MTLLEAVERLETLPDDETIYAAKDPVWRESSRAVVAYEPDTGAHPTEAAGLDYFLEVEIAKDVVEAWSYHRGGRTPTLREKFEAVLYYALYDAYDEPDFDGLG